MMSRQRRIDHLPDRAQARALMAEIANRSVPLVPPRPDRPVALYGAGDLGRLAMDVFRAEGVSVAMVIDARADMLPPDPFWGDTPPIRPDQVTHDQRQELFLAISIVTAPFTPIAAELAAQGWRHIAPVYDIIEACRTHHPLANGWFAEPLDAAASGRIADVLDRLDDDLSRAHHLQTIAWRCLREEWVFPGGAVRPELRFFIPELVRCLPPQVAFLDVGAHQGRVSERLVASTNGHCRMIWAVEPDREHLPALAARLSGTGVPHRIIQMPVADTSGPVRFRSGLGYASQITPNGEEMPATTIDDLDTAPSFVKLHVEGGELAALQGARKTLARHAPIVAATSYHARDGLDALPEWLLDACPDHRILVRLHGWCGTGAVIYAVPRTAKAGAAHA